MSSRGARTRTETAEYGGMVRRMLRAYGRRVPAADPEDLVELVQLEAELQRAIATAATGLHDAGRSWTEIAAATGVSRQAARQRWATTT